MLNDLLNMLAFCPGFATFQACPVVEELIAALSFLTAVAPNAAAMLALEDDTTALTAAASSLTWTRHK